MPPPRSDLSDFTSTEDPASADDFLARGLSNSPGGNRTLAQQGTQSGVNIGKLLESFGQTGGALGFANLNSILASQGKTDPQAFNRQLVDIKQGGQAAQQQQQGLLAQLGLQGSGIGQALNTSIGQGTQDRVAGAKANEAALAEQRKRQDLDLLRSLIIEPNLQSSAIGVGARKNELERFGIRVGSETQTKAALLNALGNLFGGLSSSCWVARAVYGIDDPKWLFARYYVLHIGPGWFRRLYLRYGERIARRVKRSPFLRRKLRPLFDRFVARARLKCR